MDLTRRLDTTAALVTCGVAIVLLVFCLSHFGLLSPTIDPMEPWDYEQERRMQESCPASRDDSALVILLLLLI